MHIQESHLAYHMMTLPTSVLTTTLPYQIQCKTATQRRMKTKQTSAILSCRFCRNLFISAFSFAIDSSLAAIYSIIQQLSPHNTPYYT